MEREIEIEIAFDEQEDADNLIEGLMNVETTSVGRKHGKWFAFITCSADRILYLGQELHYKLGGM